MKAEKNTIKNQEFRSEIWKMLAPPLTKWSSSHKEAAKVKFLSWGLSSRA